MHHLSSGEVSARTILTLQLAGSIYVRRQADTSVRERADITKVETAGLAVGARSSNDKNSGPVKAMSNLIELERMYGEKEEL